MAGVRRARCVARGPVSAFRCGFEIGLALTAALGVTAGAWAAGAEPAPLATPLLGRPGSVLILTEPPGARAWIDEHFLGTAPVLVDSLAPGRVQVVVAAADPGATWRRPHIIYADIRAGKADTLRIRLGGGMGDLRPDGERGSVGPGVDPGRPALSRLGTILPLAALGLGAAGAWTRHAADAAYRDYRRTLDRPRMNDRYRRTRQLDRASVACWIGAEACLIGAAWYWLRGDGRVPIQASVDADGGVRLGLRVGAEDPPSPGNGRNQ